MSLVERLRGCSLFHELSDREIEFLIKDAEVAIWEPGTRAVKEGDHLDSFFIVLDGTAVVLQNMDRKLLEIQKLKKLDHFGEVIFGNDEDYFYDVLATSELQCLKISFARFQLFFQKKPAAYALFLNNLLRYEMSKRKATLGLIGRVFRDSDFKIGFPLFERPRLTINEIARLKKISEEKKSA